MAIDIQLLRESFNEIKPVVGEVMNFFYDRLFKEYPQSQALFRADRMPQQKAALTQSLVTVFENLENPQKLAAYLEQMGARHVKYGVQSNHYDWVAENLIATLRHFFDATWTPELEEAWLGALGLIAENMRAGAAAVTATPMISAPAAVPFDDGGMKREVDDVLKELMRGSVSDIAAEGEIRELARSQARQLIKEALQEQLDRLRAQYKTRKAA